MKFSEIYKISDPEDQDWFDPILTLDTLLFIDPFLLYDLETEEFIGSHEEVIKLFNSAFIAIAKSKGDKNSPHWKQALRMMRFPEVQELCLGYTDAGTRGNGSGAEVAKVVTQGIWNAINIGKHNVKHFEEIQLFQNGIGRDRISDATAKIIRKKLGDYTLRICREHGIKTHPFQYPEGIYDFDSERWKAIECHLPKNPITGGPILLIPKKYLNSLPTINPDDFWSYCYDRDNKTLREQFNRDIGKNLDKKEILKYVAENPEREEEYVAKKSTEKAEPYDLNKDPDGVYKWYDETRDWVRDNPIEDEITTQKGLSDLITLMIDRFDHYIQHNGGWELLWNDNTWREKREKSAQVLFLGIIREYCFSKNIDVNREANIGRGPVDFKLSNGSRIRALIEVKKASNSKFWHGLEKQLPTYLEAEGIGHGCFLVICYSNTDFDKVKDINKKVSQLNKSLPYKMTVRIIDASRPLPASIVV